MGGIGCDWCGGGVSVMFYRSTDKEIMDLGGGQFWNLLAGLDVM